MNATMVASGTKAVPPVVSSIQDIPLAKIRESKTNPRRLFDEAKLAELAENIRQHGVLQPILVRPLPEGEAGTYELVAGARRYRASKFAKRESIPATVRELTDAQALELQVIENVQRVDVHPLGEFVERWKAEVLTTQKPSSARAVRSHLKCYIIPELGKLRLDQFGVENQQMFITRMPERATENAVSQKTILNVLGTLSTILTTARDWGYNCEQINLTKLRLPPRDTAYEAPHFTVEQVQKILAIAEEPWRTMFCIFTMDGLRAGEALGLQWPDIDFERGLLHIRRSAWYGKLQTAKSESSETVLPIPNPLLTVLKNYRTQWKPNPQGFLFVTRNNRPPSSNKVVEYHLWPILDALEIPRCGVHAFRHTHTALLLDSGATPKVVQRQLRHSDARTTLQIYGHVVGDAHRAAVEKVASIVDPSGPQSGRRDKWIQ